MEAKNKEISGNLVQQIRAVAFRGQSDTVIYEGRSDKYMYDDEMDIHWQTAGQFLIVYIESFGSCSSYYYRIYKCTEDAEYERKAVLDPAFENDSFRCWFSYKEDDSIKKLIYLHESGIWYEEFEQAISELI